MIVERGNSRAIETSQFTKLVAYPLWGLPPPR